MKLREDVFYKDSFKTQISLCRLVSMEILKRCVRPIAKAENLKKNLAAKLNVRLEQIKKAKTGKNPQERLAKVLDSLKRETFDVSSYAETEATEAIETTEPIEAAAVQQSTSAVEATQAFEDEPAEAEAVEVVRDGKRARKSSTNKIEEVVNFEEIDNIDDIIQNGRLTHAIRITLSPTQNFVQLNQHYR